MCSWRKKVNKWLQIQACIEEDPKKRKMAKNSFLIVTFDTNSLLLTQFFPSWTDILLWPFVVRLFLLMNSSNRGLGGSFINIHFFLILSLILGGLLCSTIAEWDDLEMKKLKETELNCKQVLVIHFPKFSKIWQLTSCLIWSSNFPQYW